MSVIQQVRQQEMGEQQQMKESDLIQQETG